MQVMTDARAAIAAARKQQKDRGLSAAQEQKLKAKLRRTTCSEPWVEAQIRGTVAIDARGKLFLRRYHDPHVFPPGGSQTAMCRCAVCRVWTPPQALEDGVCLDHHEPLGWGPSPSALAIAAHEFFNMRTPPLELAPESTAELEMEIAQHAALKIFNANSACGNK
jgi:hypothetical protein